MIKIEFKYEKSEGKLFLETRVNSVYPSVDGHRISAYILGVIPMLKNISSKKLDVLFQKILTPNIEICAKEVERIIKLDKKNNLKE